MFPNRLLLLVLSLTIPLLGCLTPAAVPTRDSALQPASQRNLAGLGTITGIDGRYGGHTWLGIRYAAAPIGPLRWRGPRPAEPFGELAATAHISPCPQFANAFAGINDVPSGTLTGSEDCLGLDVYAPAFAPDAVPTGADRLPVMVWIHGGGNSIGTNAFYDGSRLATEQNVIVVALNYRLGMLGWMRHPKLNAGLDAVERSGNFGTLDLIHGLGWVRDHIASFGGDPGNVTIFGESAGGHNVFTLLASPLAEGLFHRAISQSGGTWEETPARAENYADAKEPGDPRSSGEILLQFLEQDGRAASRDEAKRVLAAMSADETAAYLRDKSVSELFAAYSDSGIGMYRSPRVFLDGAVLPSRQIGELLVDDSEAIHDVPLMLGTNRDEDKLFLFFNERYAKRYFGIVPVMKDAAAFHRDADRQSRGWKLSGADYPARHLSGARPGTVFVYRWDWDEQPTILWADLGELIGAAHGFEIPFVFGHFDLGPLGNISWTDENADAREALSAAMRSYWAQFARTGAPGRGTDGDLPEWRPWDPTGDRYVVLDTPADGGIRMSRTVESAADIAEEILADESYPSEQDRCRALARHSSETESYFGAAGFAAAGGGRCEGFDRDALIEAAYAE